MRPNNPIIKKIWRKVQKLLNTVTIFPTYGMQSLINASKINIDYWKFIKLDISAAIKKLEGRYVKSEVQEIQESKEERRDPREGEK